MRYVDQIHECQVEIPAEDLSPRNITAIAEAFHRRHEELFTYCERDNFVEIINLESTVTGQVPRPRLPALARGAADCAQARIAERLAFFEEHNVYTPTPVYDGSRLLVDNVVEGPAIVEEATTAIVVFPGWRVRLDEPGMYVMTLVSENEWIADHG
jgi:N-methylhydantoinase A